MQKYLVTYVKPRFTANGVSVLEHATAYLLAGDPEQVPFLGPEEPLSSVVNKLSRQGFYSKVLVEGKRTWIMPAAILAVQEAK